MAVQTNATTVGTTPVAILSGQAFSLPGSAPVVVSNQGAVIVFVGGPNVTSTTGVAIAAGTSLVLPNLGSGNDLWAVAASTTALVVVGVF